jgi:hypothetical protein
MHNIFSDESDQLELKRKNSVEHLQVPSGLINHPFLQFNLHYEFSNNSNLEYSLAMINNSTDAASAYLLGTT